MTDIIDTVQLQSIDDSIVHLFEITLKGATSPAIFLTEGLDADAQNVQFPTKDGTTLKNYVAIPIQIEGIEVSSSGPSNRPKLTIANLITLGRSISNNDNGDKDEETFQGLLDDNNIDKPEDICGATVTHRTTLFKNTFREGDTATAPKEFPTKKYIMDRILSENNMMVQYELIAPFDLEHVKLPGRIIIGKYCPWKYQGVAIDGDERSGCTWSNGPDQTTFYDIDDNAITSIGTYVASNAYSVGAKVKHPTSGFVKIWECITAKPANVTKTPTEGSRYWKRIDVCGKTLKSCKVRYQEWADNDDGDRNAELPFGGFPGTRKFK